METVITVEMRQQKIISEITALNVKTVLMEL